MVLPINSDVAKISIIDLDSFHSIDYEMISNSIRAVPEKSFKILAIRDDECKSRAMCEVGQYVGQYFPKVSTWIRIGAEQLRTKDSNSKAIMRGLGWADCDYSACPRSPFKKIHQLYNSLLQMAAKIAAVLVEK